MTSDQLREVEATTDQLGELITFDSNGKPMIEPNATLQQLTTAIYDAHSVLMMVVVDEDEKAE